MKCSICGKKIHKHEPHSEVKITHKVKTKLGEKVVTWFENRSKCDMTNDEWQEFKLKTKTTSTYFV